MGVRSVEAWRGDSLERLVVFPRSWRAQTRWLVCGRGIH